MNRVHEETPLMPPHFQFLFLKITDNYQHCANTGSTVRAHMGINNRLLYGGSAAVIIREHHAYKQIFVLSLTLEFDSEMFPEKIDYVYVKRV